MIETYIFDVHKCILKDEAEIRKVYADIEKMKAIVPHLTADDPHSLSKCLEAADTILCLEMIFRSAEMRKETRGIMYPHYRADYPQTDNQNWLKWINIRQEQMVRWNYLPKIFRCGDIRCVRRAISFRKDIRMNMMKQNFMQTVKGGSKSEYSEYQNQWV